MRTFRGFTILETETEIREYCPDHEFETTARQMGEIINPNGEFVLGYGSEQVINQTVIYDKRCIKCGYVIKGEDE